MTVKLLYSLYDLPKGSEFEVKDTSVSHYLIDTNSGERWLDKDLFETVYPS
jgi:hypothetical protein